MNHLFDSMVSIYTNEELFSMLWYFILYSIVGWAMETIYVSCLQKTYVNRGFLHGPCCPIYGFGMIIILIVLTPIAANTLFLFLGGMLLATILEYFTGWAMEKLFHARWWDYSQHKWNLHGRICLSTSIEWGILTFVVMRVVHPAIKALVSSLPAAVSILLLTALYLCLLVDLAFSIVNALQLSNSLQRIHAMKAELKLYLDQTELPEPLENLIQRYNDAILYYELRHRRFLKAFPHIVISNPLSKLSDIKDLLSSRFKL